MDFSRVTIFTGNYGSGKTEISINYSLLLAEQFSNILLVDLDVLNPYFRSREKAEFLEEKGVEVIFPKNLLHADLPIISARVQKLIQNIDYRGVIDVGGDEEGAIALSSVSRKLAEDDYEMNLVVNTLRTFTGNVEGIMEAKERIEMRSRLKVDNIICNTNLGVETGIEEIKEGYPIVKEAAQKMGLPVKFIAVRRDLLPLIDEDFKVDEEIFPIDIFMTPPWLR
ncbi:MAG: hypothetical protein PWR10_360 [Halanaerobiales bacterium]|nr:hypothetical protein [Halanaerobiales bacterium]